MREAENLHPTPTLAPTPTHAIAKPIGSAPGIPQKGNFFRLAPGTRQSSGSRFVLGLPRCANISVCLCFTPSGWTHFVGLRPVLAFGSAPGAPKTAKKIPKRQTQAPKPCTYTYACNRKAFRERSGSPQNGQKDPKTPAPGPPKKPKPGRGGTQRSPAVPTPTQRFPAVRER